MTQIVVGKAQALLKFEQSTMGRLSIGMHMKPWLMTSCMRRSALDQTLNHLYCKPKGIQVVLQLSHPTTAFVPAAGMGHWR